MDSFLTLLRIVAQEIDDSEFMQSPRRDVDRLTGAVSGAIPSVRFRGPQRSTDTEMDQVRRNVGPMNSRVVQPASVVPPSQMLGDDTIGEFEVLPVHTGSSGTSSSDGFEYRTDIATVNNSRADLRTKSRFLSGMLPGKAVCNKCNFIVAVDGHALRCEVSTGRFRPTPDPVEVKLRAMAGDVLQKYHFFCLIKKMNQLDPYTRVDELFSNASQRQFMELPAQRRLWDKYDLHEWNNEHRFGTACELEYESCYDFRKEFMKYVGGKCKISFDKKYLNQVTYVRCNAFD